MRILHNICTHLLLCFFLSCATDIIAQVTPDNITSSDCYIIPNGNPWDIENSWTSNSDVSNDISPLVGDLDGDGVVEIVCFGTPIGNEYEARRDSILRVYDGITHEEKATIILPSAVTGYDASPYGLVKLANGHGIIVVACYDLYLRAYDIQSETPNTPLWVSDQPYGSEYGDWATNPYFADIDNDGNPEVLVRNKIYDATTGTLLVTTTGGANTGSTYAHYTHTNFTQWMLSSPIVADLWGDSRMEVILGNEIYEPVITNHNGTSGNSLTLSASITQPSGVPSDGHAQVADFNLDGHLDILISTRDNYTTSGDVAFYVWDLHNNSVSNPKIINTSFSGKNFPLIADIDNDDTLEVVIQCAGVSHYGFYAFKYNIDASTFEQMWTLDVDEDSYSNGATCFDFNQDGRMELLVCDQSRLRIMNGSGKSHITGNDTMPIYTMSTLYYSEVTIMQYPIIADVDNDGHADIVSVGSNQLNIFHSPSNSWAPARPVWNQYMYNVTNVNKDLTLPQTLYNNASQFVDPDEPTKIRRPYNNYMQQATITDEYARQIFSVADAAITHINSALSGNKIKLNITVRNKGAVSLNAPLPILAYANEMNGLLLADSANMLGDAATLAAGGTAEYTMYINCEDICANNVTSITAIVNATSHGIAQDGGLQAECNTSNNSRNITIPTCNLDTTFVEHSSCDSYDWEGLHLTHDTTVVKTLTSIRNGLDSVVQLTLTILHSNSLTILDTNSCESFSWVEAALTTETSTTLHYTFQNIYHCDSIVSLNVTIGHANNDTISHNECNTFHWDVSGIDYTESGQYSHLAPTPNSSGCDSTVVLNLTISDRVTTIESHSVCDSFLWIANDSIYYQSSYDSIVATASTGCDSVSFLVLTMAYSSHRSDVRDICDSLIWEERLLTTSGTYHDTITNIAGCDSIQTLSLTVRHSSISDTSMAHGCDSFVWDRRNETYISSGLYKDTTVNGAGCDSIVLLDLTLSQSILAAPRTATACGMYEWTATNRTLDTTGTYYDTLQSSEGCDSIITLSLTILQVPQLTLSNDTILPICGTATMQTSGAEYLLWGGNAFAQSQSLLQGPSAVINLQPRNDVVVTSNGYTTGENIVINGDFSDGNIGFTSDHTYSNTLNSTGQYAVANYARGVNSGFYGKDHTTPTLNTGNFMIVDSKVQVNSLVWRQTVDVIPYSDYIFSMWGTSVTNSSPAQLQVFINDSAIGPVFSIPTPAADQGNWRQHFFVWHSGNTMRGDIRIVNRNGAGGGNDFGIDDISLRPLMCHVEKRARIKVLIDTTRQSVCDAFTWRENGMTYTESGNYTATIRTRTGCDSIRILTLTVANNYIDTNAVTACQRYFWHANSTMYEESGLYRHDTDNGDSICDTTHYLRLTILDCEVPLPDNVDEPWCTTPPPANAFEMRELFSCDNVNSMSTPMVGDVDGDGIPEIIACRRQVNLPYAEGSAGNGILVFDGQTGAQKVNMDVPLFRTGGQLMSLADVDRDGEAEFFLLAEDHYLYCYSAMGRGLKWRTETRLDDRYLVMTADVNADSIPEVVCGPYIFNALNGALLLHGTQDPNGRGYGAPHSRSGHGTQYFMQALVDIDFDNNLEFCAGNTIYKPNITNPNGTDGNTWSILRQARLTSGVNCIDGQTFLADFDNDGDVDICVIGSCGSDEACQWVWDGQTSELIGYYQLHMSGAYNRDGFTPSIPFCGDLDGNGTPEIIFNYPDGMRALTYCDTLPNRIRLMHFHRNFGETAGFTVFDFNQDGREEIVYRNTDKMYIVDGTDLSFLCSPLTTFSGTVAEYTIVADVNADGHAEIIVNHAYARWNGYNAGGKVSVFGSSRPGAWGSARKVWNQWAYSSVNINEDLTVPVHQFDIASTFPNGKEPFNGFLRQMPHLDQNGDIYMNTPNIDVTNAEYNTTYTDSSAVIHSSFCNYGDNKLEAPFYIAVYEDDYRGKLVDTFLIDTTAFIGSCLVEPLEIHTRILCHLKCDSLAIAINDAGMGIAQNGGQQPECDTTNNVVKIPLRPVIPKADTLVVAQCDSFHWSAIDTMLIASSFISDTITDILGCDSVRWLKLTIYPSYYDTIDTIGCDRYTWNVTNETFTYDANTTKHFFSIHSCDSVHHLSLEMHYRYDTTENVHACQHYTWSVDHRTYNRTTTHTETMLTQYGCDSIRTLVVTIYQPYHDTIYDTICQGHTRTFGGITLTEEGHYQHKVPMMTDCDSIHDLFLSIRPLKPLEVTWTSQCELLQYTVTARNPETDTIDNYFLWESFPPDEEADAQNRQQTIVVHPALATIYTAVSAYDKGLACPNKVSVSLTPTQPVKGHIRLSTNILSPELKEFRASAEGSGFNHQQWHIDGEPYSDNSTISYTYDPESNIDSVRIRLQVSNGYCFDSDSVVLRYYVGELFVPNFFAPSEERVGTFKVSGIGILDYEIHIYDRRGLLVFESEDIQEPWTGSLRSGEKAPQAAYVYTIRYRTAIAPDEWKIKTGSVVLLR